MKKLRKPKYFDEITIGLQCYGKYHVIAAWGIRALENYYKYISQCKDLRQTLRIEGIEYRVPRPWEDIEDDDGDAYCNSDFGDHD